MAEMGGANWIPGVVTALLATPLIEWLKLRGAARKEALEQKAKEGQLQLDSRKADDDSDAKLIASLMAERKDYQEEIKSLRIEAAAERERCDREMAKLRDYFEVQVASLKQFYQAEIDLLRGELMDKLRSRKA